MKPAEIKPEVPFATLAAVDLRVGAIQSIHDVAGSSKLIRMVVDFGDHTRNILAGMKKERPDVSAIVGRQALFVVNLPPRTMAGEVSEGMLFDVGFADGIEPALLSPERPVPNGTRAG
jgi:tRNA-binding protein